MNVAKLLDKRRADWTELERLCDAMEMRGRTDSVSTKHRGAQGVIRFSTLYRSACADLALADAYQLPPNTVMYLHRLVARAHNQLYRTPSVSPDGWGRALFYEAPQQIFNDGCVKVAALIFFGLFALSMAMGAAEDQFPDFAASVCGTEYLDALDEQYQQPLRNNSNTLDAAMFIWNNTGIGLQCFAYGILLIPCILTLAYNAIAIGTSFGYMSRDGIEGADNFFEFVTAHGPLELTAIALAAGAGLRLGVGLFYTKGLSRVDSLRDSGRRAVPVMAASAVMFVLAAFTEGFLSPSGAPYLIKAAWSVLSSGMITFYFVILGFPRHIESESPMARTARYEDLLDSQVQFNGGSSGAT